MLEAKLNLGFLEKALNTLRRPDLRPAWKEARIPLREDIKDHRARQAGPGGSWAPRSGASRTGAKRKPGSKRKPRQRKLLGKLPTALTTISDRRRVAMKSRVAWSDVHTTGGTVGHGAKIPPRPFLWASDKVLTTIAALVSKALARAWGR